MSAERNALSFVKMHGCGNDFVVVDARSMESYSWSEVAAKILDRRFGVGGDSLLIIESSLMCSVRMRVFERSGQESENCGNGLRCIGRYLLESDIPPTGARSVITVETLAGAKRVEVLGSEQFRVNMGKPRFDGSSLGLIGKGELWDHVIAQDILNVPAYAVSMGNPHAVMFVAEEPMLEKITSYGPQLERQRLFVRGCNIELAYVVNDTRVKARVWERGAGETWACGTGACAIAVAGIRQQYLKSPVLVDFRAGSLVISWLPGDDVWMTGPAQWVYKGEWLW